MAQHPCCRQEIDNLAVVYNNQVQRFGDVSASLSQVLPSHAQPPPLSDLKRPLSHLATLLSAFSQHILLPILLTACC